MRGLRAPIVIVMPLLLAACSLSGSNWGGGGPTATNTALAPATATVNTAGSGCDDKIRPGDCWLPLYPSPEFKGDPLNLDPLNGSCTRANQANCWPQPGTTMTVVCLVQKPDGTVWFGAIVPLNHTFSNRNAARPVTGGVLGYNKAQWLQLASGSAPLTTCP